MSTISAGTTPTTTLIATGDTTGSLVLKTNDTGSGGTTAVTIDTSQNVGIGTTSPGSKLDVKGTLRLSGSSSGYVGLAPAAAAGSTTYTLPSADGTNGQFLSTNGTGTLSWGSAGSFAAGTAMLFVQTAAPTGWTKSATHNDKALRVVSGTASSGGTTAFSTVFANQTPTISNTFSVGNTTLSTSQIPSHSHNIAGNPGGGFGCGTYLTGTTSFVVSGATGGGGSHNHTLSGSATSSAITLNAQYVDVIIATKD